MDDVVVEQVDQEWIIHSCPLLPRVGRLILVRLFLVILDIFTKVRLERSLRGCFNLRLGLRDIRFRLVFRLRLDFMLRLDFRLVFLLLLLVNLSRLRFSSLFCQFDDIVSQLVANSPAAKVVVGAAHLHHGDGDDVHDGWRGQLASQVSSAARDS